MITHDRIDLDTVAASIVSALPKLDSFEQRLSLELYRLLAACGRSPEEYGAVQGCLAMSTTPNR